MLLLGKPPSEILPAYQGFIDSFKTAMVVQDRPVEYTEDPVDSIISRLSHIVSQSS